MTECLMIDSCVIQNQPRKRVHLYEPRDICIWLTPNASNQVDDTPFKSFPFVRLVVSIHVYTHFNDFGKSGKLRQIGDLTDENDNCERLIENFRHFTQHEWTDADYRSAFVQLLKLSGKPFHVIFGSRKGKSVSVARCIDARMKELRFSIFPQRMIQWLCSAESLRMLIEHAFTISNQLIFGTRETGL